MFRIYFQNLSNKIFLKNLFFKESNLLNQIYEAIKNKQIDFSITENDEYIAPPPPIYDMNRHNRVSRSYGKPTFIRFGKRRNIL